MWIEIHDEITVVEIRDESPSDSSFMTHFIINSDGLVECHFFFAFLLSVVDAQKMMFEHPNVLEWAANNRIISYGFKRP